MRLYFIRHGQSENNLLYRETGSSEGRSDDPALTETGRRQARLAGQFIRGRDAEFGLTHLYTSLMVRAVETASIIADELSLPVHAWQDLHEGGGIYYDDLAAGARIGQPGKNREFFAQHFPGLQLPDALGQEGWWNRPFEEVAEMYPRAERVLGELIARHGNTQDRVGVVSHGGFYNALLRTILKIGREDCWFEINNTAISRLDLSETEVTVLYLNRADFLPPEIVT